MDHALRLPDLPTAGGMDYKRRDKEGGSRQTPGLFIATERVPIGTLDLKSLSSERVLKKILGGPSEF